MISKLRLLALLAGALLTLLVLGTALAEPPTPAKPATPPATGAWESMREWMDSQWGQGFTDKMHGSSEGMVEGCNTVMGSGGMTGGGGMMGGSSMMSGGGATGSGGMMGPGTGTSNTRYGGMMGASQAPGGGWGGMMANFMGGVKARLSLPWF